MANTSKMTRFVVGVPLLCLFAAWSLWELGQLRMPGSGEVMGYDIAKLFICAFASYVAWRAWRWVSGKDSAFGKTNRVEKEPK